MNMIQKIKVKMELYTAKGILAEIFKKCDWNIDNLDIVERRRAEKIMFLVNEIEKQLNC